MTFSEPRYRLTANSWRLYYRSVRDKVLHTIRKRGLLRAGDRIAVAVSGGADSVAMLRILLELRVDLGVVLAVAHYNHALRGDDSDADEHFVAELARQHDLPFFAGRGSVPDHAHVNKLGIERAAREMRYQWLLELARQQRFEAIATAHTADDQAETVLMKFLRGTSTRGLAGIHPVLNRDGIRIVRPLLETARVDVEEYLASVEQQWCEDQSNRDKRLTRNRIRHELLPLLERDYNPNLRELLSETADVARAEEDYWRAAVESDFAARHPGPNRFLLAGFDYLNVALQRRLLKSLLDAEGIAADFCHVEALRRCALGEASRAEFPGGWFAFRKGDCLALLEPAPDQQEAAGYQYTLAIPGEVYISEIRVTIRASLVNHESARRCESGTLLGADATGPQLLIRNWRPGDRFRPAHSGSDEKLKRLFSEKHIPADQRPVWPVALSGSQIAWVRELPVADHFVWTPGAGDAFRIDVFSDE